MNYSTFIVKIIKKPVQSLFKNDISLTEFIVQFPQTRNKNCIDTFHVTVWGNLFSDILKYYQNNDYIFIEGYISLCKKDHNRKQIRITAFKIYPFFLDRI